MHDLGLIVTLSVGLAVALVLGYVTHRLKLSPILGYLLAGIALGPHTPGFVADSRVAAQFAELGVILLMFGVGLHFHLKDLLAVKSIAIPGAIGQSLLATALGTALALSFGWKFGAGLVFGIGVSVASTVVLMRVLMDNNRLETPEGHIAVGWLVVEDILTVLVLVLLPAMVRAFAKGSAGAGAVAADLGLALLKVAALAVLVLVGGKRLIPWFLTGIARTRSRELFTLAILVIVLAVATASAALFGVSMALGAFLAGMVVGQSRVSHQAAADALPMRDAFAVLFFVSVGMLFDPRFLFQHPVLVAGTLAIILVGKPLAALLLVGLFGSSVRTGLVVAVGLAQIGEFSFILAELARNLGVLPGEGHSVLVAGALISITLNPLLFRTVGPLESWLRSHPALWKMLNRRSEALARAAARETRVHLAPGQEVTAIVVGYGPVGQAVTRILRDFRVNVIVVDMNVDTVNRLTTEGIPSVFGDAGREEILRAARIDSARYLIVTLPEMSARILVLLTARELNPSLKAFVRAHYIAEKSMLEEVGATAVCYEEAEAAVGLAGFLLREVGADEERIAAEAAKIRGVPPPRLATPPSETPPPDAATA